MFAEALKVIPLCKNDKRYECVPIRLKNIHLSGTVTPGKPRHPLTFLFTFQVPCQSWFDDMQDTELLDLIPFFEGLAQVDDVYSVLRSTNVSDSS